MCQGLFCQSLLPATLTKFRLQTCQMFCMLQKGNMLCCYVVQLVIFSLKKMGARWKPPAHRKSLHTHLSLNPGPSTSVTACFSPWFSHCWPVLGHPKSCLKLTTTVCYNPQNEKMLVHPFTRNLFQKRHHICCPKKQRKQMMLSHLSC